MKKNIHILQWIILFILLLPGSGITETNLAVKIDRQINYYNIDNQLEYLEDKDRKWSIQEVSTFPLDEKFIQNKSGTLNFGYSNSAYWLRFKIENTAQDERIWVLEVPYTLIDEIILHIPEPDGSFKKTTYGRLHSFYSKEIKSRTFAFNLATLKNGTVEYYLRVTSEDSLPIPVRLWEKNTYQEKYSLEKFYLGMYYGVIAVMIFFNLFLFLTMKDITYIFYVLTIITLFGFFQFALNGFTYQFIGPESIWWARTSTSFFFCLGMISVMLFSKSFLQVRENIPWLNRALNVLIVLASVEAILTFCIKYSYAIQSAVVMGMVSASAIWLAGWISLVKGNRTARFYMIAWSMYILSGLAYSLKVWSFIPSNYITEYSWQAGGIFVSILLSMALGDRINLIKKEKFFAQQEMLEKEREVNEAREKLIDNLREMDSIKDNMNRELEQKVKERTEDLQHARDALWGEMELAKKIQTVLLPDKPAITGYEISAYMKPADEVGGDYYDIINVSGMDWIVIGDVSGHGVSAGLVMMMVQTSIQVTLSQNPDLRPSEVLTIINKTITRNIRQLCEDKYMTITVIAAYKDGNFSFSGLHQDIMIYRTHDRDVQLIETRGFWIGIMENIDNMVQDDLLFMGHSDTMLIFTDGITEAWEKGCIVDKRNPMTQMYSAKRLADKFRELCLLNKSSEDIIAGILSSLHGYDFTDDVTLVVLKRL